MQLPVITHHSYLLILFHSSQHVYDAVELHSQKIKSSSLDYEIPPLSTSGKIPSAAKLKQDVKADTIELQENPSYQATDEIS